MGQGILTTIVARKAHGNGPVDCNKFRIVEYFKKNKASFYFDFMRR
jgi:hypothetical protein